MLVKALNNDYYYSIYFGCLSKPSTGVCKKGCHNLPFTLWVMQLYLSLKNC